MWCYTLTTMKWWSDCDKVNNLGHEKITMVHHIETNNDNTWSIYYIVTANIYGTSMNTKNLPFSRITENDPYNSQRMQFCETICETALFGSSVIITFSSLSR